MSCIQKSMTLCKKTNRIVVRSLLGLCMLTQVAALADDKLLPVESGVDRSWIGPGYWANPMVDWQLKEGRLVCTRSGANHDVQLTSYQLAAGDGTLSMKVRAGIDTPSKGDAFSDLSFQ